MIEATSETSISNILGSTFNITNFNNQPSLDELEPKRIWTANYTN